MRWEQLVGIAFVAACGTATTPAPDVVAPEPVAASAIDLDDPATCAPCHGAVVEDWKTSMHSQAHHANDPIYGAMRELRMAKQGSAVGDKCLVCHTPRAPEAPLSPAATKGVSCATCHASAEIHLDKGPGAKAITFDDTVLRSARDVAPGASPVHGTGPAAPHLADGVTMCRACHDATMTPSGAPACTTGPEFTEVGDDMTCVGCHMPQVEGSSGAVSQRPTHASHAFLGPHHAWRGEPGFLGQSVGLQVGRDGSVVNIGLQNKTGHAFPTGFPGRLAALVVEGRDAKGEVVWRPTMTAEGTPDPASLFRKVYVDAEGKPVPAPFAKELKVDTRLTPNETRLWSFVAPDGVVTVDAKVVFRLLPPPLAEALGLADDPVAEPRVVVSGRLELGADTP